MAKIEEMHPQTGRMLKEDNSSVNMAEMIEALYNAICVNKDAGVTLTGSNVCLSTEPKPAGQQNDTLLEYNPETKKTKVYKYISGDWREL